MNKIKQLLKKLVRWALQDEINKLNIYTNENYAMYKKLNGMLENIDASVDYHHQYGASWAVISLQGKTFDYIKFVDLGNSDIMEIQRFLRRYDRTKVDAAPSESAFLRIRKGDNNRFF